MNSRHLQMLGRLMCASGALLLASCTITHNVPQTQFASYTPVEKIHLRVALNITDELRKTRYDFHELGETDIWPLGPLLVDNVLVLARQTFMDVVEIENGSAPPKPVDAVLTLRVPYLGEKAGPGSMFSESGFFMKFEWTLINPNGDVIWADTVAGEKCSASWMGLAKFITLAMENTLQKSQQAMLSSQAIRQFAAKKYPNWPAAGPTNGVTPADVLNK
jgi:hypothetical protein